MGILIKNLKNTVDSLVKLGAIAIRYDSVDDTAVQFYHTNLAKLNLEFKVESWDNGFKYKVYTIIEGIEVFALADEEEIKEHFPLLLKEVEKIEK